MCGPGRKKQIAQLSSGWIDSAPLVFRISLDALFVADDSASAALQGLTQPDLLPAKVAEAHLNEMSEEELVRAFASVDS